MGKVVGGMAMSLDGFVDGQDGQLGRLYQWLFEDPQQRSTKEILDALGVIEPVGAVVMGRNAFDMNPDGDYTEYEFQVPIFVITHDPPKTPPKARMSFTFVTIGGIESAVVQAKEAAGSKDVMIVGGINTIRAALKAGLLDEIHLDIAPVLFGRGERLFGEIGVEPVELDIISVIPSPGVTHLKYRIKKDGK